MNRINVSSNLAYNNETKLNILQKNDEKSYNLNSPIQKILILISKLFKQK